MNGAALASIAVLAVLALVAGFYALNYRARLKHRALFGSWPIRTIPVRELDPAFAHGPFGPSHETEVRFIGRGDGLSGGTSDAEAWILAVLAKNARAMFEFGTFAGKTTYLWARNAPEGARIVTLTLAPHQVEAYTSGPGDSARDVRHALKESTFERFFYTDTDVESRITQLYGDSKAFDESPYLEQFDLIFVDGSHAYTYVLSDSEKALRMCRPGGLILWHDYAGPRHSRGVYRALNELSRRIPLVHVRGTMFVAHRKPRR